MVEAFKRNGGEAGRVFRRVLPGTAAGAMLLGGSAAFAQTTPNTITTYTDAVGIQSLIETGGTILAGIVAAAVVIVFAMLVVKAGVRWFKA